MKRIRKGFPIPIRTHFTSEAPACRTAPAGGSRFTRLSRGQDRFTDGEIFRPRDLDVLRAALHDRHAMSEPFDQLGIVGRLEAIAFGLLVRLPQELASECLRGLREPQVTPI